MLKIMIVKTWCENTQEGVNYLKYNGYGKVIKRIPFTDLFVCIGYRNYEKLNDVIVVK